MVCSSGHLVFTCPLTLAVTFWVSINSNNPWLAFHINLTLLQGLRIVTRGLRDYSGYSKQDGSFVVTTSRLWLASHPTYSDTSFPYIH